MPNWCTNHIHIHGDRANIASLWENMVTDDEADLMAVLPIPEDIGDGWYGWCVANWGTKWPMSLNYFDKDDDHLYIQGDTAWSPPLQLLAYIATTYEVLCDITFSEPGMDFCGAALFRPDGTHDISEGSISDFMPEVDESDIDAWHEAFMETLEKQTGYHEMKIGG